MVILSPRGLQGDIPGDWATLATGELRLPLTATLPVNLFGLGLADATGALFADYGVTGDSGGST